MKKLFTICLLCGLFELAYCFAPNFYCTTGYSMEYNDPDMLPFLKKTSEFVQLGMDLKLARQIKINQMVKINYDKKFTYTHYQSDSVKSRLLYSMGIFYYPYRGWDCYVRIKPDYGIESEVFKAGFSSGFHYTIPRVFSTHVAYEQNYRIGDALTFNHCISNSYLIRIKKHLPAHRIDLSYRFINYDINERFLFKSSKLSMRYTISYSLDDPFKDFIEETGSYELE